MNSALQKISVAFKKDSVLFISGALAVASCFFVPLSREYLDYINIRVLALLFCLMGIVAGIKEAGAFDALSHALLKRIHSLKTLVFNMTALCFFMSMFLTNDVALVTIVPFTLLVFSNLETACPKAKNALCVTLALETVAANLGSMLTPVGNPQNLFLFARYEMQITDFLKLTAPYSALSFALVAVLCFLLVKNEAIQIPAENETKKISESFYIYLGLFILALLTVGKLIPWQALLAIVCIVIFFQNKKLFARVDYVLLLTFVFFFVFVGNLGRVPFFRDFFESIIEGREVLTSILASQFISNVPAALLLSSFTQNGAALVIGTNLGGLGTIIASMASLITYKFCAPQEHRRYLAIFSALNFGILILLYAFWRVMG